MKYVFSFCDPDFVWIKFNFWFSLRLQIHNNSYLNVKCELVWNELFIRIQFGLISNVLNIIG